MACTFSTSEPSKLVRTCDALYILTWKFAARHNCVYFFDISTSKSGPQLVCFVHFDLDMCFAPHRSYTFFTSQLLEVLRSWGALCILTWKCASRHNSVQFFISHLARWLRTRRFREPNFRPSRATNHWKKHSESRLSYLFAHLHLLSSLSFSSLIFSLLFFSSLTLPTSAFPSVHIVGSLTSKLPANNLTHWGEPPRTFWTKMRNAALPVDAFSALRESAPHNSAPCRVWLTNTSSS